MYPNLKLEIWRSGLRQNRLARELNIDETVLSKVINGYREPTPHLRALLAEYFQKDEHWLFFQEISARKPSGGSSSRERKGDGRPARTSASAGK